MPLPSEYEVDGVDVWGALSDPAHGPHRQEVLISDNILRVGNYKLIAGGGSGQTGGAAWRTGFLRDCMLGTGGGLDAAAPLAQNNNGLCPGE